MSPTQPTPIALPTAHAASGRICQRVACMRACAPSRYVTLSQVEDPTAKIKGTKMMDLPLGQPLTKGLHDNVTITLTEAGIGFVEAVGVVDLS